jgi:tape measure domain-containing protein
MQEIDVIVTQFIQQGVSGLRSDLRAIRADIDSVEGRTERLSRVSDRLISFGASGAGALALLGGAALKSSGNMARTQVAFEKMLGSAEAGKAKIAELQKFAAMTPFSMAGLVENSKQLLAMGFTADELIPTMHALGGAMAALGGNDETFQRVIYNLGQIRAQGKAYAVDLRQFAMAGINVADVMEQATGKKFTRDELTEMDGEDFIRDFKKGLEKSFGGVLEKQTETLPGKINNLGDAFERLKITTGDLIAPEAIKDIGLITDKMEALESWIKAHPDLAKNMIKVLGVGAVGAVGLGVAGKFAGAINEINTLRKSKKGAAAAADLLTKATKADSAAELTKAGIAGRESDAIDTVSDAVQVATGAKGKLAERTLAGAAASATATQGAVDLAEATTSYGKASATAERATSRLTKANALRGRITDQLTKTETALEKIKRTPLPTDPLEAADAQKKITEETMRLEARRLTLRTRLGRVGGVVGDAQASLKTANANKFQALETMRGGLSKTADMSYLTTDAAKAKRLYDLNQAYEKTASKVESTTKRLGKVQTLRDKIAKQLARTETAIEKGARAKKPMDAEKSFRLGERRLKLMNRLSRAEQVTENAQSALDAANAQKTLAQETVSMAEKAAKATPKLGLLAKAQNLFNKPIAPAMSRVPQLATKAFEDPITGELIDPKAWNAAKMAAARGGAYTSEGLSRLATPNLAKGLSKWPGIGKYASAGGEAVTIGGAAMAGLQGIGSGISAAQNYEALGYEKGDAYMRGAATGIGVAAGAMFVPGGAVAAAIAEGIGGLVNHFYTEPIEKATSEGTGPKTNKETAELSQMSASEKADYYFKKRDEALANGDSESAQSFMLEANSQRRRAKEQQKAAEDFALNQRLDQFRQEHGINKAYRMNKATGQYEFTQTRGDLEQQGADYQKAMQESRVRDAIARGAALRNGELTVPNGVLTNQSDEDALLQTLQNRQGQPRTSAAPIAGYGQGDKGNNQGYDVRARQTGQRYERNGNTRTKIEVEVVHKESPGDRQARIADYNSHTPMPRFR